MTTKIVNKQTNHTKHLKPNTDLNLIKQAIKALNFSYSPYSKFKVGAAILKSDGKVYLGSNLENASYPLCLCAERTAIAHAHMSAPKHKIIAIAVVCKSETSTLTEPGFPCGACRQVISEFEDRQASPIRLLVGNVELTSILAFSSIKDILPHSFDSSFLK